MDLTEQVEITLIQPNIAPVRQVVSAPGATFGRATECTIPIRDRFLSRRHAEMVFADGRWLVRDCGSANGTFVNGNRLVTDLLLRAGDRIALGDCEILVQSPDEATRNLSIADGAFSSSISIPFHELLEPEERRKSDHLAVLNSLALELIEDRSMQDLFDFILDRIMSVLHPSRAAVAILSEDKASFISMTIRRQDKEDTSELTISRTLLAQVVGGKKIVSFLDTAENEKLGRAMSIIGQSIRSAVCAPLVVGEAILGILYVDFLLTDSKVTEDEVRLLGKIGRFAAVKLETTRLREQATAKQAIEQELKTAYVIQSRLLPAGPPRVEGGYSFAGINHPCRTVSGDYFDYFTRPDGKVYFVLADVSGKGITAALITASLWTAFNIYARSNPTPAELVRALNETLHPKLSPSKFVTLVVALLDPELGEITYTNAGHCPPLLVRPGGITSLNSTDLVIGLFPTATYRDQVVRLEKGEGLVLFTDGILEAEGTDGEEFGMQRVIEVLETCRGQGPECLLETIESAVRNYLGAVPAGDDITLLALTRSHDAA